MNSVAHSVTTTARTASGTPQLSKAGSGSIESVDSIVATSVVAATDSVASSSPTSGSTARLSHGRTARRGPSGLLHLQFDVDTGGKVEALQGLDRLAGRFDDVDEALVDAHLEVLAAVLVDVR